MCTRMMDDESMDTDDVVAPFQEANNLSQPDSISYPSSFPGCAGASAALVASPVSPPAASPVTKTTEELANMKYISPHAQQVSMAQYNQQAHYYTQQALRDLKTSTEYKKHTMKCHRFDVNFTIGVIQVTLFFLIAVVAAGMMIIIPESARSVVDMPCRGPAQSAVATVGKRGQGMWIWYEQCFNRCCMSLLLTCWFLEPQYERSTLGWVLWTSTCCQIAEGYDLHGEYH